MDRYPHKCLIQKVPESSVNNPFAEDVEYEDVYSGDCRCYNSKLSAYRNTKVMDCDYCVSVPDGSMPAIGENYKVCIKYQSTSSDSTWDLVGYVKDFRRYDRNCEIYFQMVKMNMVEGDMPE